MKIRIEAETAARLFGCKIGDFRDVQRQDALPMIDAGDVAAMDSGEAEQPKPAAKPKAKRAAGK